MIDLIVYLAHGMTGRDYKDVEKESQNVKRIFNKYHIKILDPLNIEKKSLAVSLKVNSKIPNRPDEIGKRAWYGDKAAIRRSHIVLDITPETKSEGVLRELGYARFYLWKPVVRLYKKESNPHMITVFEDDAIVRSLDQAAKVMIKKWGTKDKRIRWRRAMLKRCLPNFIEHQIEEFK